MVSIMFASLKEMRSVKHEIFTRVERVHMCMQKVALDIENLNTRISALYSHGIFI